MLINGDLRDTEVLRILQIHNYIFPEDARCSKYLFGLLGPN